MAWLPRFFLALLLTASFDIACAGEVSLAELPRQAQDTLLLIARGGPYPHKRDGVVFNNFEKRLPEKPRGYYHEYTVATPGAKNRGARRIVCGGKQPWPAATCYYSANHYRSFQRIRE
jgi:ribonuclease T1